ncbi:MAG: DUF4430 domain-containing protein [Peptococcaceae bacterium]|jgi:hypothetical protein|nr:DUF4430 domain-containing protein [Peptococcaceae bacterium]
MKRRQGIILAVAVVVCLLAAAWFWGGSYPDRGGQTPEASSAATARTAQESGSAAKVADGSTAEPGTSAPSPIPSSPSSSPEDAETAGVFQPKTPEAPAQSATAPTTSAETPPDAELPTEPSPDKYLTDPVPSGKPLPIEPQEAVLGNGAFTCTLSVRCDTILNNMKLLNKEKHELVPLDGVIFPATAVTFYEGESVFNILQREMKRAKIHLEFMNTPIYNSAYIEGLNNFYEFDVGELSGWMYKVNGWFPNYGCSRYQLQPGDVVEWVYTCDLGRDLGQTWIKDSYR